MLSAGRWLVVLGAVSAVGVASAPARQGAPRATPRLGGVVFGGVTPQRWPVVVQVTRDLRRVTRAVIGIDTRCTSGSRFSDRDGYVNLAVSRSGRFSASFGPTSAGSPSPGITETAQGSIAGRFNKAHTKVSGSWRLTFIDRNAAGTTTDTCDSGAVSWTAKQ